MISSVAQSLSSTHHITKSRNLGHGSEKSYFLSCKSANLDVRKAPSNQDMRHHVDFILEGKTVDVKGMKDTHKLGQILLEIKNVQGKQGWCSFSGPDWIAFDFDTFFLHARNADLIELVQNKCDLKHKVFRAKDALYKAYTRKERMDLMTVVTFADVIKHCKHWRLPKTN
jgi:hypothetical protein